MMFLNRSSKTPRPLKWPSLKGIDKDTYDGRQNLQAAWSVSELASVSWDSILFQQIIPCFFDYYPTAKQELSLMSPRWVKWI